jgi:hypothetical protein
LISDSFKESVSTSDYIESTNLIKYSRRSIILKMKLHIIMRITVHITYTLFEERSVYEEINKVQFGFMKSKC